MLPPAVRWNLAILPEFTKVEAELFLRRKIMDFVMPYWEKHFGRERSW